MLKLFSVKLLYCVHSFLTEYFSNNQKFRNIILVLFLVFSLLFSGISTVYADQKFKVLVLHSYHTGLEWTDQIMAGIRSVFNKSDIDAKLLVEYMDTEFNKPEILSPLLQKIYAVKYHKSQPDMIISSDNHALNFLLSNRDLLFPGVPIVFCGINNYSDSLIKNQINITGVAENFDIEGTIDLALHLHPETRQIVVVSDLTHTAIVNLKRIRRSFSKFTDRVSFVELTGLTTLEYKEALNRLPDNSLVIHNGLFHDSTNREEGLDFIDKNSRTPVYTLWRFLIKHGVMGGVVVNGFSQGEQAALMAVRILQGESPDQIPVLTASPNVPIFDYNVMSRFGINRSDLPEGSIVLNIPSSFYTDHKDVVWMAIGSMTFLSFIIAMLVFNINIRRRAEDKLRRYQAQLEDQVKKRTAELEIDITKRKQAQLLLKESEKRYHALADASFEAVFISEKGYCVDANAVVSKMFGYSYNELMGLFGTDFIAPESHEIVRQNMLSGYDKPYEAIAQRKDGTKFYVEIRGRMVKYMDSIMRITVIHDIDKRKKFEQDIRASLQEKEVLIKEVHHRVKNNMQVISSLLKLQAANSKDEIITQALMDCKGRLQAMAFVHETLYNSKNLVTIDFKTYISGLVNQTYKFFSLNERVKWTVNAEDITIGIDQATPLGLIINELVLNSLKYAFPENQQGEIAIGFQRIEQDMSELVFQDNGTGIPKDINWRNTDSLGLQLVVLLAENQLNGTINLSRDKGTRFNIKFKLKDII